MASYQGHSGANFGLYNNGLKALGLGGTQPGSAGGYNPLIAHNKSAPMDVVNTNQNMPSVTGGYAPGMTQDYARLLDRNRSVAPEMSMVPTHNGQLYEQQYGGAAARNPQVGNAQIAINQLRPNDLDFQVPPLDMGVRPGQGPSMNAVQAARMNQGRDTTDPRNAVLAAYN